LEIIQGEIATNDFFLSMTVDAFEIQNYNSILADLRTEETDINE